MAYRESELGLLVRLDPKRAAARILKEYRASGGVTLRAAEGLGVDRRTLERWLHALDRAGHGIRDEIDDLRDAA